MSLYNLRNPAVKRLMREADELKYPTEEYFAQPLEDNLFEWHFTLSGPPNTEFEGGIYHGRITLPPDYPMKPPSIILLTPNGRFETNKKVCLSISGHHPESWRPSWSIRTALLAIIGFLPTHGNGAIGSLDYTPEERKKLALKSQDWKCQECGYIKGCLKSPGVETSENCDIQNNDTKLQSEPINNSSSVENVLPNDEYSGRESDSENSSSTSSTDFTKNIPGNSIEIASSNEGTAVLRQRNLDSNECTVESMQPNTSPVQSVRAKSAQNNYSLIVIWVISLILVLLIIRRWFSFDYTV
ncbi:ubiquitin-conjugating enzyme E2 J1 [Trichonephila inaurata madagascariensis]|uniref:Ubiquitin-conjugating enzyme E2 J1 n=1 Tax=Trichonephila inaurata madagascariensis TaxID=2747483 RepID=A0A8X6YR09_9ARAC|nr:ubiquitin-conjugating enzyme E2 J1 [Trichonephila inaurata madagascariensis]